MATKSKNSKKQNTFLNELRKSGRVNMFACTHIIRKEFKVDDGKAKEILTRWMNRSKK